MVGAGNELETFYKKSVVGEDSLSAEDSNKLSSKTLIPNIGELNQRTSLIDMAGYEDNRDYRGVMGVSYFLKKVFEHVDRVKFIIVVSE